MSKETREFDIAIMDFSNGSIRFYRRTLPKDIETDELEEILETEGVYKQSECYLLTKPTADGGIKVEDNR